MSSSMNRVQKALEKLISSHRFYANFFLNCNVIYDNPQVERAAAGVDKRGTINLYFNLPWMESIKTVEAVAVIKHEIMHIMFEHIYEGPEYKGTDWNHQMANVAMDGSINQWIPNLPGECITLEWFREKLGPGVEVLEKQTWIYYYNLMKNNPDKFPVKSLEDMLLDSHEFFDSDGNAMSKEQARAIVREALDKAMKASAGDIPGEIKNAIGNFYAEPKINWKQQLRVFVAKSSSSTRRFSNKKPNRRMGFDAPGTTRKRELTLGVITDSSGSVSDEAYASFLDEIADISKHVKLTYLIDADCQVQNVEKLTKKKKPARERSGYGGTAYQPGITKAMELKCDAIIYFGDMDAADRPTDPGVPFLWVIVGNQEPPGNFGGKITLS